MSSTGSKMVHMRKFLSPAVVGFVILAGATGFSFYEQASDQHDNDVFFAENRIAATRESCETDKASAIAIRKALDGQIRFVKNSNEPPPPTVAQRVASIKKLQKEIIVPDCTSRIAKAVELLREVDEDAADDYESETNVNNTRGDSRGT